MTLPMTPFENGKSTASIFEIVEEVGGPQPLVVADDRLLGRLVVRLPHVLRRQAHEVGPTADVIEVGLRLDQRDVALLRESTARTCRRPGRNPPAARARSAGRHRPAGPPHTGRLPRGRQHRWRRRRAGAAGAMAMGAGATGACANAGAAHRAVAMRQALNSHGMILRRRRARLTLRPLQMRLFRRLTRGGGLPPPPRVHDRPATRSRGKPRCRPL